MNFSSKLIDNAVTQFSSLPGIGKKTALRLVLHLLKQESTEVEAFGNAFIKMRNEIKYCNNCHNISDAALCEICSNPNRNHSIICVVEDIRDVIAIESTNQFNGTYHLLGGIISPMEGIGPKDLNIETLINRVSGGEVKEIIMALSTTMEGDTTNFYLYKRLKDFNLTISTIARGIAVGDELEYADEITLGRSILQRTPYESSLLLK
ncbi:MAG: recombination protein RecR [Bacteroidetes bacterium]|nr:recombination protein RecR [Bacteroidota bacterium]